MMNDAIELLGWTLVHFVWQGAIVGTLAATMLLALQRRSASTRYLTAVSALGLMMLLPLATIAWIEQAPQVGEVSPIFNTVEMIKIPRTQEDGTIALDEPLIKVERIGIDFENPPPADAVPLIPVSDTGQTIHEDLAEQRSTFRVESYLKQFIPWAVAAWLIGVGVLSLRLLASWLSVQRLRRRATQPASENWQALLRRLAEQLRATRPVQLVESALVEVPTVIGWLKPIILLPATAMTGLTTKQLEALLAHELAHVRRHDYLINLLQTVIETLLFYHPAVWWVSHRIRVEREHCCDDLAVQVCDDGLTYAKALVALEELRAPKLGLAMSSSGGSLLTRVTRLLDQAEQQRQTTGWIAGLLALMLLTMTGTLGAGLLTPPEKPTAGLPSRHDQETRTELKRDPGGAAINIGRFVGRVRLKTEKPLPDLEQVKLPSGKVLEESLVFSKEGGLANVFVYLRKPTFKIEEPADAAEPKPFFLIAEDWKFWPHAALVRVGRPVVLENRLGENVNFHTQPIRNNSQNILVPVQSHRKLPAFTKAETIPFAVKSDIQPWMQSQLLVLDHPFADVTDDEGRFTINGLPPGQHDFCVWHERVGWLEKSLMVTIKPGEESRSDLEYEPHRLKLEEAEVQNWSNRQIDTRRTPRPKVPRVAPADAPKDESSDARSPEVNKAVERGIVFLKAQQQDGGSWQGTPADGVTALCAAALLQAGVKPDEPVIQKTLAAMRKVEPSYCYTVALQTMVFCAASPKEDAERIRRNVTWLEQAQATEGPSRGAWSYAARAQNFGDGSCSRFAMLGLHAAKRAGFEVKAETWKNASDYYLSSQKGDSHGWGYMPQANPTPSMTLAAMAGLAILNQHLPQDDQTKLRTEAIERAVPFVEPNAHLLWHSGHGGYALQCLERAAHLNRWQKFGKHELRKLIDEKLIGLQRPEGHWTGVGGSGGGFFVAPAEQTPEQKAAAEAARRRQVQSDDLIATSFALMCLTGQLEPPREH